MTSPTPDNPNTTETPEETPGTVPSNGGASRQSAGAVPSTPGTAPSEGDASCRHSAGAIPYATPGTAPSEGDASCRRSAGAVPYATPGTVPSEGDAVCRRSAWTVPSGETINQAASPEQSKESPPPISTPPDPFDTEYLKKDLKGRSIRGGVVTVGAQAMRFVLRMGSTVVLARILSPDDFGLIAMVTAVTGFAMMFKDLGLSMATIQREKITHQQVSNLFWVNVAMSLIITAALALAAPAVSWFYGDPRLTPVTRALAVSFVFGGLTIQHQALLRRHMRFKALGLIDIAAMATGVATAIVAALMGAGYWSLVLMHIATAFATMLGVWLTEHWLPAPPTRKSGTKPMLHFGKDVTGFNIVNYFARNLDNILIGRFIGAAALGLYNKAYNLMLLPIQQINAPLSSVAVPALSRLASDTEKYKRYYLKTVMLMAIVTMPLGALFAILSKDIIVIVLGNQWLSAAPLLTCFAAVMLAQPIANPGGWVFVSLGKTAAMFRWGIISTILTLAAIGVGLIWGTLGVAISYAIMAVCLRAPLQQWYISRISPINPISVFRTVFAPLVASISLFALLTLINFIWSIPSLPKIGIATFLYLVALTLLAYSCFGSSPFKLMRNTIYPQTRG